MFSLLTVAFLQYKTVGSIPFGIDTMSDKPKNILFVLVDQLRWDYLSCYGHPHLHTPNIDWLAENGVRFEYAYAQAPLCGPSRACISTGRYMSSHGGGVCEATARAAT